MSYLDAILQQKHLFLAQTGKEPKEVEVNETLWPQLENDLKDMIVAKDKNNGSLLIAGLKVVLTQEGTVRVK